MDISSLSAEEIKAARERLASRKSFFGGSVSTRQEAAAPAYRVKTQAAVKASQIAQDKPKKPKGTGQQTSRPAAKRPQDAADDFGDLDDYNDLPKKPCTNKSKAGDMWGQYLAAQQRKEEAQHTSAAKERHAGRDLPSRPPVRGAQPRTNDVKRVAPGAAEQKAWGAAGASLARLPRRTGRGAYPARARASGGRLHPPAGEDEEDLDGFIDDDLGGEDWRSELQAVTGYDPSKFAPVRDDSRMQASRVEIEREERQSKRAGRQEDEKAEIEERRLRALKEAKRERHRSKSRKTGGSALLLD